MTKSIINRTNDVFDEIHDGDFRLYYENTYFYDINNEHFNVY